MSSIDGRTVITGVGEAGARVDVSIVIPVYNGAATVGAAVQSALEQSGLVVEVIVVDDGSIDDPGSALPDDSRITLLTTPNRGVSSARNLGWTSARGRMVIFLDADDTISDRFRARDQLAMLDRQGDLAVIHSGWEVVEREETVACRTPWTRLPTLALDRWIQHPVILPSAMAFRRASLRDVDGFDVSLRQLEDVDLVIRLLLRGWKATWLERVTTRYHRTTASASSDVDAQARAVTVILDRLFADPDTPDSVSARQRVVRYNMHVWLASCYQRADRTIDMAAQLAASSVWYDGPPGRLPLDWVQRFVHIRADEGWPPLDVSALTADPAWQSLVRAPAIALLERGIAVVGPSVLRPRPVPENVQHRSSSDLWSRAPVHDLPPPALDCGPAWTRYYGRHRSGWAAALDALRPLHVEGGVLVDAFVEHSFQFASQRPHRAPWIGFLHNPVDVPSWYPLDQSAPRLLGDHRFRASLDTCRGLFTLSETLRDWWATRIDVPVEAVPFPTGEPLLRFSLEAFHQNPSPRIVQVGTWLRKLYAIHTLPVRRLQRTIVHQHQPYIDELFATERQALGLDIDERRVETLPFLDDLQYDELLSCNLVFIELYGASANNAVVECMIRGTPILVNPLPAVREYLGDDYPLYFNTRAEAALKAEDDDLIAAAHRHLVTSHRAQQLSHERFVGSIAASGIYRELVAQSLMQ